MAKSKKSPGDLPEAPPAPPPAVQADKQQPAASAFEVDALRAQVANMSSTMETMAKTMETMMAALGARAQDRGSEPGEMPEASTGTDWGSELYWVRIKPYNKRRGYLRTRMHVPEIGRPLNGGTGMPGSIPEWVSISRERAVELPKYRQRDGDMDSPPVFDIATEAEMKQINRQEDQLRMANLGMAGLPPAEVLKEAERGRMQAKVKPGRERPTKVEGSDRYTEVKVSRGRAEALNGFDTPQAPTTPVIGDGKDKSTGPVRTSSPSADVNLSDVEDLAGMASRADLGGDIDGDIDAMAESVESGARFSR